MNPAFGLINTLVTADSSIFVNCIFEYGYAQEGAIGYNCGGAVAVQNFSKIRIDHCLFRYNWVDQPGDLFPSGGAIGLWTSSPLIKNSEFCYNHADLGGAIMAYTGSHPTIQRCLFHHNIALIAAGAVIIHTSCAPHITNCTFIKNSACK